MTAAGGVNISYIIDDVGLATNNPALLSEDLHSQVGLSFNNFFSEIKSYNLAGAYHHKEYNTTFSGALFYLDYGNTARTDAAGNEEGSFRPRDFVFQISAARKYLEKWRYGIQAKFIKSDYGLYNSSGIAFDFGLLFSDTVSKFSFGFLAKNMGYQLSTYSGSREDLPFDLQIGATKKLIKAPLGFSLTAHHIHQWDLSYNDTLLNSENGFSSNYKAINNLFNHFVLATHFYLGNHLQLVFGYNRLRRDELNLGSSGNGLNGFSGGFTARFQKLQMQYSRAYFQRSYAYNQFGVNIFMDKLIGGKTL